MNTKPLSEVLASATPLPWRLSPLCWSCGDETPTGIQVSGADHSAVCNDEPYYPQAITKANAALLCHAANMLPELEAAFSAIPELLEILADDSEELGMRERPQHARDTAERLRLILSRARAVPMP